MRELCPAGGAGALLVPSNAVRLRARLTPVRKGRSERWRDRRMLRNSLGCSPARAKRALLQPEPSPLHIGAEILALRHGIVTGLVLAPAVLFRLAEAVDIALSAVGEDAIAPLVVGAHLLVRRIGVAVAMHREAERQPRRDKRRPDRC